MASKKLQAGIAVVAGLGTFSALHLLQAALDGAASGAGQIVAHAALLGILTAIALFFALRQLEITQELHRAEHLDQVIAELNHHIRNALQVILNRAEEIPPDRLPEIGEIREAVNRIDWSLREILPRGYGSPHAGENGAGTSRLRRHQLLARIPGITDLKDKTYSGTRQDGPGGSNSQ